uniref:LRAT domain-containing protein n=1 Tax=Strigamia maritima TaxID=126957 RepID=T1IVQ1_STRMM
MYAAMASMISLRSRWFRLEDMDEIFSLLQEGDLLEFDRGNYSHWAVYVGIQEPCNEACIVHNASSLSLSNGMWGLTFASCHSVSSDSKQKSHKRRRDGSFSGCSKVTVRLEKLIDVLGSDQVRINNTRDRLWSPYDSQVVKQRALNKVSERISNYNALNYNCEHFVNDCRYGRLVSMQMIAVVGIAAASTAIFGSALTAAMAAKIAFMIYRRR